MRHRLRDSVRLAEAVAEIESLRHYDGPSYDADDRIGAQLISDGRVIAERVERPAELDGAWNPGAVSLSPWPALSDAAPVDHPRVREDRARSSAALLRDALDRPWSALNPNDDARRRLTEGR